MVAGSSVPDFCPITVATQPTCDETFKRAVPTCELFLSFTAHEQLICPHRGSHCTPTASGGKNLAAPGLLLIPRGASFPLHPNLLVRALCQALAPSVLTCFPQPDHATPTPTCHSTTTRKRRHRPTGQWQTGDEQLCQRSTMLASVNSMSRRS